MLHQPKEGPYELRDGLFAYTLTAQIWDTVAMTIETSDFVSQCIQTVSSQLIAEYG